MRLTQRQRANPVRLLLHQHLQLHLWMLILPSLWGPCSYNLWSCSQKPKCMEILLPSILFLLMYLFKPFMARMVLGVALKLPTCRATIVLVSFHRPVCRLLASRPFGKTSIREIRNGFQMMLCSNAYMINLRLPFALNLNKARSWTFAAMMNLPCPLHRFL